MRISPWRAALLGIVATVAGSGLIATTTSVAHAQKNRRICMYAVDTKYTDLKGSWAVLDYKKDGGCPKLNPAKLHDAADRKLNVQVSLDQGKTASKITCEGLPPQLGGNNPYDKDYYKDPNGEHHKVIDVCTQMTKDRVYLAFLDISNVLVRWDDFAYFQDLEY